MRKLTLALSILLCAGFVQAAGLYRWVDKDGKVHYTDRPIENAELIGGKPAAPEATEESEPKTDEELADEARTQKCELAKQRLEQYQQAGSLFSQDEFGNKRTLSAEEQVQSIVDMQKQVEAFCDPES